MTRRRTRRRFLSQGVLAGATLGTLAGCLSRFEDDSPPVDASESELLAIANEERPAEHDQLPIRVTNEYVDAGVERVETLLGAIPSSLASEIPNEAIQEYIQEERADARGRLDDLADEPTNYARLSVLRSARRDAAEAETAYAVATDERSPADIRDEIGRLANERSAVDADLTRTGEDPTHAALVYEVVERRLDAAERFLEESGWSMLGASAVELAGALADRREWAAGSIDDATHLAERQAEVGDRRFDDDFERTAAELRDDVGDRSEALPTEPQDAATELFDAPIEDTPREVIASDAVRQARGSTDSAAEYLDEGRLARSLLSAYSADVSLRATDRLQESVDEGAYDRPADAAAVRSAREDAIEAIESVREETSYPYLAERRLPISGVRQGDWWIDRRASPRPDQAAVHAVASYGLAAALARSIPAAIEWFVAALP